MLHKIKTLEGYTLDSLDGEMGHVKDFYFDDEHWTIRYLVADTGAWLRGRAVLISPHALVAAIREEEHLAVDLTKRQIEESPSMSSDKPISRQFETDYHGYYGWGAYWAGPMPWGLSPYPYQTSAETPVESLPNPAEEDKDRDPHLRSTHEVTGYHIQATDGEIGHVEDFVIDDVNWAIRYLIVDTRNWWPGKKVIIGPKWIDRVSWSDSKVFVNMTREAVKLAPEYTDDAHLNRDYEESLHAHYEREGYWTTETPKPRR